MHVTSDGTMEHATEAWGLGSHEVSRFTASRKTFLATGSLTLRRPGPCLVSSFPRLCCCLLWAREHLGAGAGRVGVGCALPLASQGGASWQPSPRQVSSTRAWLLGGQPEPASWWGQAFCPSTSNPSTKYSPMQGSKDLWESLVCRGVRGRCRSGLPQTTPPSRVQRMGLVAGGGGSPAAFRPEWACELASCCETRPPGTVTVCIQLASIPVPRGAPSASSRPEGILSFSCQPLWVWLVFFSSGQL